MLVNSRKYSLVNSSVTHVIAKIDNYSVYRQFGNNFYYSTNRHEITVYYTVYFEGSWVRIYNYIVLLSYLGLF